VGTVDLTTITLSSLKTTVIAFESDDGNPVSITLTTPASVGALITQIQAGIDADGSDVTVSLRAGKYLVLSAATLGSTSTMDGAAGTGMALVGISPTAQTQGVDSVYEIPGTGVQITFGVGTHEVGTVHSIPTTAPKVATADFLAAMQDMRDEDIEFAGFIICQENWADQYDIEAAMLSLSAEVLSWQTGEPYRALVVYLGATAGADDQAIRTVLSDNFTRTASLAIGGCWALGTGSMQGALGALERSTLIAQAIYMCARDESRSIGERESGVSAEILITSPDGLTKARDEFTATTKMQDRYNALIRYKGQGFFMTGRTLANPATEPGFNELTWLRPFNHAMQVAHDALALKLEGTHALKPDGTIREALAAELDEAVNARLQSEILNPTPGRPRASSARFRYDRANPFATSKAFTGKLTFQPLGIAHSADVIAEMVGTVTAEGT
jgi:hypothetical protein